METNLPWYKTIDPLIATGLFTVGAGWGVGSTLAMQGQPLLGLELFVVTGIVYGIIHGIA